jgi:hypothetical protein
MDDARTPLTTETAAFSSSRPSSRHSSFPSPLPTTTPTSSSDVVPPFAARVVALFDDTLKDIVFPGLDRTVLHAALSEVEHAHAAVIEARRVLDACEATLADVSTSLVRKAERAVAYARVYADGEGDDALIGELDGLASSRNVRHAEVSLAEKPRGKRRGRPPLNSLPLVESTAKPNGGPHTAQGIDEGDAHAPIDASSGA